MTSNDVDESKLHVWNDRIILSVDKKTKQLTNIWNVEREPVQESVADQFGKQQTERELHHSLCETQT